jgi:hypothetical protein
MTKSNSSETSQTSEATATPPRLLDGIRSPFGINRCDTAPTPTGFAETVGDYFPQLTLVWFFSLGSVDFVAWANGGLTALLARGAGLWRGF